MARTKGSGTTITCTISGKSRPTTYPYLVDKSTRLGVSVADLKKFYICREVITQLNKGMDVFDLVTADCKETLQELLQEKSVEEMIALNSRSKKNKAKAKPVVDDADIDLTLVDTAVKPEPVQIEEPLSPETEQYLAKKAELLGGQEVVDEIHKKVWGEEEEVEEEVMA